MLDDRAERQLEKLADWALAHVRHAPNEDTQREWIYQALSRAWTLGERQKGESK